jgi:hypothetical protein
MLIIHDRMVIGTSYLEDTDILDTETCAQGFMLIGVMEAALCVDNDANGHLDER